MILLSLDYDKIYNIMMTIDEKGKEFEEAEDKKDDFVHVHFLHRHVPSLISYSLLVLLTFIAIMPFFLQADSYNSTSVVLESSKNEKIDFIYGSWPALQNADFFKKTKEDFILQEASFIEADLSAMIIRFYEDGKLLKEAEIQTKGREGSWWETPAGLYKIVSKERDHFSSIAHVFMPWSLQFQGNFFIHGPTYYPDGTPTSFRYTGGCIRIPLDAAEEIYNFAKIGTPVLVFEESFNDGKEVSKYKNKNLLPNNVIYLAGDLENNFIFAENKSGDKHSVASIAKLVSALVAAEYINVKREVTINSSMLVPTSIPRLEEGDHVPLLDLLSLLLQESSNEAALAITAPLGNSQFIKLMNVKSEAIGMKNSSFADTSGVLSENISTAEDLFHLAKYLYHNRSFILHMSIGKEDRVKYGPPLYSNLRSLNVIPDVSGEVGGKIGLSSTAGESILAVFEIEIDGQKHPIAIIVLGSGDVKSDVRTLFKYITDNFSITADDF